MQARLGKLMTMIMKPSMSQKQSFVFGNVIGSFAEKARGLMKGGAIGKLDMIGGSSRTGIAAGSAVGENMNFFNHRLIVATLDEKSPG